MSAPAAPVKDTEGHAISVGDLVTVVVGPKRTIRPGVVDKITPKNVIVVFVWGNGRVTRRSFPRLHDARGITQHLISPKGETNGEQVLDVFDGRFHDWPYSVDDIREMGREGGRVW